MAGDREPCFQYPYRWPAVAETFGVDIDPRAVEQLEDRDRALEDALRCAQGALPYFIASTSNVCC